MPRIVRRASLYERLTTQLNPRDFALWLSEEIETRELDSKEVGTYLGLGFNFLLLLARANSGAIASNDDVFGDVDNSSWLSYFVHPLVWVLVSISLLNAFYAFTRTRSYRLFQADVEKPPATPSARRVKVQSTPVSSSPMRLVGRLLGSESAESRAHPDKTRDVWELSVWDPLPVSLQLFQLFSPGHVLVYLLFLPLVPLDPRPSVTVFCTLIMQGLLSGQLLLVSSRFAQQAKDTAIVQKEVMHEYDTKFVRPRLQPVVRDVGTQMMENRPIHARDIVQVFTPTTQIRHSFQTHPNPNYIDHVDPDHQTSAQASQKRPNLFTTPSAGRYAESMPSSVVQRSSVLRQSLPANSTPAPASPSTSVATGSTLNFGGSMGVHTHSKSPLKKATSYGDMGVQASSPRNSREMAAYEQERWARQNSPAKESHLRHSLGPGISHATHAQGQDSRFKAPKERYPSRW
ncbi:hypothetical protein S40285_05716 [Stachybotrys chlorohalonatus IBT 40285]|uniref:Meiotically up-regulated gene 154 protein n=1 Tax=Stachybotrys chlorohalonatus (strain IBT 40285) TaxID=1283841 RepID=A0A084QJ23_STAC4|nr:hypothetical protein S40285_05716 [Stachybotrys chlorohalonata IBT 40285]